MILQKLVTSAALVAALAAGPVAMAAQTAHDHAGRTNETALKLDNGKKWQTDAPLRQGMEGIRRELSGALPAIHKNELPAEQYAVLANKIEGHVGDIVKNCKLPPAADAQLHVLLGKITQGTQALRAGNHEQGAVQIAQALDAYGDYFQHPNWQRTATQ